jgi:biopolymer transport protein ExbD
MTKPNINVTPLIDVLLVLLIIFMVISPLKPSAFKAKIPAEPQSDQRIEPNPLTLVVAVNSDASLSVNKETGLGSIEHPEQVIARLRETFSERLKNQVYAENIALNTDLNEDEKVEKTVFIKAPRGRSYGDVAKVIDAVKQAGARPISLQIDDLQ